MTDPVQNVVSRLNGVKRNGDGFIAPCPAHDDHHPSLCIRRGDDGRVLLYCHAGCHTKAICEAIGLRETDLFVRTASDCRRKIVDTYDYQDADGKLLYQVVRYAPKQFKQRRPDGADGWIWNLKGIKPVLYQLSQLLAAAPEVPIFIPEGEKDVERLASIGLLATTNSGGAGKWQLIEDVSALDGRDVVLVPDKDEAGFKHSGAVGRALLGRAKSIRWLELPGTTKDISEWLSGGGTKTEFLALVSSAPEFDPSLHGLSGVHVTTERDPVLSEVGRSHSCILDRTPKR